MLNYTFSPEENQIILNCNILLHLWHPGLSDRIQWHREDGSISVSQNKDLPYEEDVMALQIHCEDFQKLITKRLLSFKDSTSQNLRQLYDKAQMLQGMRLLLDNYHQVLVRKALYCISQFSSASTTEETPIASIARLKLGEGLLDLLQKGKSQLIALEKIQQRLLSKTYIITLAATSELNEISESQPIAIQLPRPIKIGQFTHLDKSICIQAHLMLEPTALARPTTPLLADLTTIQFQPLDESEAIPVLLMAYPRWSTDSHVPSITLTEFKACPGGAKDRLARFTSLSSIGVLPYETPSLATTLCGPFAKDELRPLLPRYFQAMIEIAKAHHCYQVVCFIPFDFTLIAHAMGFYSSNRDEQDWCQKESEKAIINNLLPELLAENENQFEEGEELCRPVFFPLNEIATRKVHFGNKGHVTTTYAEVIEKMPLFNNNHGKEIIPDPYGFMTKPVCTLYQAIRKREITGKHLRSFGSTYYSEATHYEWLADNQALLSIGESTHLQPQDRTNVARILKQ